LANCIDKGLSSVKSEQDVLRKQVEEIQQVADTLDPEKGDSAQRQADFRGLIERFVGIGDPFHEHMAKVMSSFQPGLFVGGDEVDQVRDNLDLEVINMPGFGLSKRDQPRRWPWTHMRPTLNSSPSTISYRIGRHARPNANVRQWTDARS
jgi:hypothetical protein